MMSYLAIDALYIILMYCLIIDIGTFFATKRNYQEVIRCGKVKDRYHITSYNFSKQAKLQNVQILFDYVLEQKYRTHGIYEITLVDEAVKHEVYQYFLFKVDYYSLSKSYYNCEIITSNKIPEFNMLLMKTQDNKTLKRIKDYNGQGVIRLVRPKLKIQGVTWLFGLINGIVWLATIYLPYE